MGRARTARRGRAPRRLRPRRLLRRGLRPARPLPARGPVKDDALRLPATHYGVYKVANEEAARIYWEGHRIPSTGFRPLYGPGRDFGVTAAPTLAMKAALLGRAYRIPLHGESIPIADVARVIEEAWPAAKGLLSHAEPTMPFAEGVRRTVEEFKRLQKDGRLDARELG